MVGGEVEQGVALTHTHPPSLALSGDNYARHAHHHHQHFYDYTRNMPLVLPALALPWTRPAPLPRHPPLPPCFACQLGKLCAIFNF